MEHFKELYLATATVYAQTPPVLENAVSVCVSLSLSSCLSLSLLSLFHARNLMLLRGQFHPGRSALGF